MNRVFRASQWLASFAIASSLSFCSFLSAQVLSGSLTGAVADESRAMLPNAKALLTEQDKGFTYIAVSHAAGRYVLRNLPPGRYELSASFSGMEPFWRETPKLPSSTAALQ